MICIRCGHDSKYKERAGRVCPQCKGRFAFEPREGDKMTDAGFRSCIQQVSANGQVRWGVEHLYYEVCRRENRRKSVGELRGLGIFCGVLTPILVALGLASREVFFAFAAGATALLALLGFGTALIRSRTRHVPVPLARFSQQWRQWVAAHGSPEGVIVRPDPEQAPRRSAEADIGDYSFDRAVICDRARTVDLLLANNFHFENNCAVLSIDGYPPGPSETVRAMLKRNPRLQAFALHDASFAGCALVHRLANDPAWFQGQVPVVDVGLRPSHAGPFHGLLLPGVRPAQLPEGVSAEDQAWLTEHTLELAAVRPEQVIKRLYRAINRKVEEDTSTGDGGGGDGGVWIVSSGDGGDGGTGGAPAVGAGTGGPGPGGLQGVSDSLADTLDRTSDVLASGGGAWSGGGAGDLGGHSGAGGAGSSGFDAGGIIYDFESFSADASASDDGADGFG